MRKKYILALDSGTIKNRAVLFDNVGNVVSYIEKKIGLHQPKPGQVEQDADEIWGTQLLAAKEVLKQVNISPKEIAAIGVTNQRETTIVWNRNTGLPICPAISWQSRQTKNICDRLKAQGLQEEIRQKTSLIVHPYFSATKLCWILENIPGARQAAINGDLLFGTIDTWLMWKLSRGKIFATDYSNASRTMLFNLRKLKWDPALLKHLDIPRHMLPDVYPSAYCYGFTDIQLFGTEIPITGCIGNQQADLFGSACFDAGMAKNTYGEGSFFLINTGDKILRSDNGLIATIAWALPDKVTYALEGSIVVSGSALNWLKNSLGLLSSMADSEWISKQVETSGGVYFIPSFRGLFAPYWDTQITGMIIGLKEHTQKAHIIRAALESLAYQVRDVYEAIVSDTKMTLKDLRVDGGASRNNLLMQFQADILNLPIIRPYTLETTALGAAYIAALAVGFWKDIEQLKGLWHEGVCFMPNMSEDTRNALYDGWQSAIAKALGWY